MPSLLYELKVPLGLDDKGNLVSPTEASKNRKYFCPSCNTELTVKLGNIKIHHFAHKPTIICNGETITHKTAKLLIQKHVMAWKQGVAKSPTIERFCDICNERTYQEIPNKVDDVKLEYRMKNGFIVDVALMNNGIPLTGIEVKVTHPVGDKKSNDLSMPFIEVNGTDILEDPLTWKPTIDKFNPYRCRICKNNINEFFLKANQISKASNIPLPKSYYRYGISKCYKCKKDILVFTWTNGIPTRYLGAPAEKPIPKTIQYRYSKTMGRKYWMNTCPYCNASQGEWFLSSQDGPFPLELYLFYLGLLFDGHLNYGNTEKDFKEDLFKIAKIRALQLKELKSGSDYNQKRSLT